MKRHKKYPVSITNKVNRRMLAALDKAEEAPVTGDVLASEPVQTFIHTNRGPQEPAGPPRLFEPLPLVDVAEPAFAGGSVIAILFLIAFLAGLTVGKLL